MLLYGVMPLFKNVSTLKDRSFVLSFFGLLLLILPGLSTIVLYVPELLVSLDWVKVALLSASITAPLALINAMTMGSTAKGKQENDNLFHDFIVGIYTAGIIVYISSAAAYFLSLSISQYVVILLVTQFVMIGIIAYENRKVSN